MKISEEEFKEITDKQLKEWKEAEQYLTPSPWHYDSNNKLSDSNHKSLIDRDGYFKKFNDAEFCSRARKYFPLLIQAYEEQKEKIKELEPRAFAYSLAEIAEIEPLKRDVVRLEQLAIERYHIIEEQKKELKICEKEIYDRYKMFQEENYELYKQIEKQEKEIEALRETNAERLKDKEDEFKKEYDV